MSKLLKTVFFTLAVVVLSTAVGPALAQLDDEVKGLEKSGLATGKDLKAPIAKVINVFLGLVGIIAVAAVIYGGFKYITSAGEASRAEEGKRVVLYAIVGIIIVGLSAVIINFVLDAVNSAGGSSGGQDRPTGGEPPGGPR